MQPHVKNYLSHFGYDTENIPCESCNSVAVEIHHIKPRSWFGSKRKAEQDDVSNLVALCRACHDKAHASKEFNNGLKILVAKRDNQ